MKVCNRVASRIADHLSGLPDTTGEQVYEGEVHVIVCVPVEASSKQEADRIAREVVFGRCKNVEGLTEDDMEFTMRVL